MSEAFGSPADINFPELNPTLIPVEQAQLRLFDTQDDFLEFASDIASRPLEQASQEHLARIGTHMFSRMKETMKLMPSEHKFGVPIGSVATLLELLDRRQVSYYQGFGPSELSAEPLLEQDAERRIIAIAGSEDKSIMYAGLRVYVQQTKHNLGYLFGSAIDD